MEKIKTFLKRDSDFLRKVILLLIGLLLGIYGLFFSTTHRISSIIGGVILLGGSAFAIPDLVSEWKKIRSDMKRK